VLIVQCDLLTVAINSLQIQGHCVRCDTVIAQHIFGFRNVYWRTVVVLRCWLLQQIALGLYNMTWRSYRVEYRVSGPRFSVDPSRSHSCTTAVFTYFIVSYL